MKPRYLAVLAAFGLLTAAFVAAQDTPPKAPETLPAAITNTHELMEVLYEPIFEKLKKDMAAEPADRRAWSRVKHDAIGVAELANLTAIRKIDDQATRAKWAEASRSSQQAGLDLAAAATAKDWAKTQSAYKALVANCNACHKASTVPFGGSAPPQLEP